MSFFYFVFVSYQGDLINIYQCQLNIQLQNFIFNSMKILLFLSLSLLLLLLNATTLSCNFQQFKKAHNKTYDSPEIQTKKHNTYMSNCLKIQQHNEGYYRGQKSFKMDLPSDGDQTQTQIVGRFSCSHCFNFRFGSEEQGAHETVNFPQNLAQRVGVSGYPSSLDYAKTGIVSKDVPNQGRCGSCWAFAATGMYEAALMKHNLGSFNLSEEAPLECTNLYSLNGRQNNCKGGFFKNVLNYFAKVGGLPYSEYPYKASNWGQQASTPTSPGICKDNHRISVGQGQQITRFSQTSLSHGQMKWILANKGPIIVGIHASYEFMRYKGGIFDGCTPYSKYSLNHAVLLIGYDEEGNWIIRNSWGTQWGEEGFITIKGDRDCGLLNYMGFIKFDKINENAEVKIGSMEANLATTTSTSASSNPSLVISMLMLVSLFLILQ